VRDRAPARRQARLDEFNVMKLSLTWHTGKLMKVMPTSM